MHLIAHQTLVVWHVLLFKKLTQEKLNHVKQ